jgi:hypothetical protein
MRRLARVRPLAGESRGGVLAFVALFAPVAVILCAFVINMGDAWWHKRHLQTQADAAAFAAALDLAAPSCSNAQVTKDVDAYGGYGAGAYNPQVGGLPASGTVQTPAINSQTYPGQTSPVDTTVNTAAPCTSEMVDVKMTEANLPFFFPLFKSAMKNFAYVNAQARVELKQETQTTGNVPLAVNDISFAYGEAYFIDETPGHGGAVIQGVPLTDTGTGTGLDVWTSSSYNLTVPAASGSDVGVRIALSGASPLTGTMATDCAKPGVMCFDGTSQLLDVHGVNPAGTGTPSSPVNHGVIMMPGSCGDQYYTVSTANCFDGLQATLDIGTVPTGATVTVSAGTGTGGTYPYPLSPCTGVTPTPPLTAWCSNGASIPVAAGSGRTPVNLQVVYTPSGKKPTPVTTTFTGVQSTYAGSGAATTSGPIESITLNSSSAPACLGGPAPCSDVSSLQQGSTYPVYVNVGISPSLSVGPKVTMRFDGTGSQNQSVNCTANPPPPNSNPGLPNDNFLDAMAFGCKGPFQVNPTLGPCPDTATPADCVPPYTGNKTNQAAAALNWRILQNNSKCISPDHWPNYQPGDPRIVTVLITPYNSFSGSGSSTSFPIQSFAAFYITGWNGQGNGNSNPCQPSNGGTDDAAAAGTVVGHFIHYVQLDGGSGGTKACVANALNECYAVMTR